MNFDLLAPHYRWMEAVLAGKTLQRCRTAWLDRVTGRRNALLIGEGNGRFLSACAEQLPDTHFTVVDASARMLELAQANWLRSGGKPAHASFVQATLPGLNLPAGSFDLVVTNCFLDCFPEELLGRVVNEVASLTTPDAVWLLSDFDIPKRGFAHWRARAILGLAYTFFRISTKLGAHELVPPAPLLERNGFVRRERAEFEWGLLYSELWERQPVQGSSSQR